LTEEDQRDPPDGPSEVFLEGLLGAERELQAKNGLLSLSEIGRQIVFYRQLLGFEREMLERMRNFAADHQEDLRRAVELSNIEPMEALIDQLQERLSFWQQRERELRSG
jgi:hypothetical protein